jgi:hypothetical protein
MLSNLQWFTICTIVKTKSKSKRLNGEKPENQNHIKYFLSSNWMEETFDFYGVILLVTHN